MKKGLMFTALCLSALVAFTGCKEEKRTLDATADEAKAVRTDDFNASGWTTNENPVIYGSKDAKKGGTVTFDIQDYPPTLRTEGAQTNMQVIWRYRAMVYQTLLGFDLQTQTYSRNLASHWKVNEDQTEMEFRINPEARWHDGKPVTADDVVATFNFKKDEGIGSPYTVELYSDWEAVKTGSHTVKITAKTSKWTNFAYISGTYIYPAHYLEKIDGATYLEKYNEQLMPGSGPYVLDTDETVQQELLAFKRIDNFWGENNVEYTGMFNFDKVRWLVIMDDTIRKEKFKKGDFDIYSVNRAQWWAEEFDKDNPQPAFDALKNGWVQRAKAFSYYPKGTSGIYFNMREEPFNDIRMRKAFTMLWDVETLRETMFFNEYDKLWSNWPASAYQGDDLTKIKYSPEEANRLLDEMGWTGRDSDGYRTKDGERLSVEMPTYQSFERIFTPYQEDLKKAGIEMKLKLVDGNTLWQMGMERRFKMKIQFWGATTYPSPRSSYHSSLADTTDNNNLAGIKNAEIDRLIDEYDKEFDADKRVKLIQEMDNLLSKEVFMAYGWGGLYAIRHLYWNKFGMPESMVSWSGDSDDLLYYWWYDEDKAAALDKAMEEGITIPHGPQDVDFWGVRK